MLPPRVLVPLIVACALFMENLDSTVLATSLPAIARDLGEDPIRLKLAVTSYLLSLAVFIPASGWVADRYGARLVFRLAILVFTFGSILCGLADGIVGLVVGRIVQGMGGAMMVPVGRLVILRTVPKHELVGSMAWLTVPALIGPVLGPLVGGAITTYASWRFIFWVNVPIGIVGILLATRYIPDVRADDPGRFDTTGFWLSGLGLVMAVTGSTSLGLGYWPLSANLAMLAAGAVLLAAYVRHAGRAKNPIIDLELLRIQTFRANIIGGFFFRIGIGATPFLLPLMLQEGFGLSAFNSGVLTFAAGIGAISMKMLAAPILRRFGFRRVLVINAVISTLFLAAPAAFTAQTPWGVIMTVLLVGGFFRSLQFTAINSVAYADIDQRRMSRATGFISVAQQLSLSVGVSIGALAVEFMRGSDPQIVAADFPPAFILVAILSALAIIPFLRLPPDAGAEMSGHGQPRPDPVTLARQR